MNSEYIPHFIFFLTITAFNVKINMINCKYEEWRTVFLCG